MKKIYSRLNSALLIGASLLALNGKGQIIVNTFSYNSSNIGNTQTGAINTFTVPPCVTSMTIEVVGASGGFNSGGIGGAGARMLGVFAVTPGQVLTYLVGKSPGSAVTSGHTYPAGGGGSYVANGATFSLATAMIVAGGGGGGYSTSGDNSPITTSGTGGTPGTGGNGAPANSCGGGGGGFFTTGGTDFNYGFTGGLGFRQGGTGGSPSSTYLNSGYQFGGFGGGAPANYVGSCNYRGGAGGGYSGGSAYGTALYDVGAAGGSFNSGTNQSNTAGFNTGHGRITFSYTPGAPIVAAMTPSTPICTGGSVVLNVSGVSTYTWDNNSNATSLTVTPSSTTNYTVIGTNASGCTTSSVLTVIVNTTVPNMSINTSTNSLCFGKTVTLTATGAFSYTWTGGVINGVSYAPLVTSDYTVTGSNGCGTSTAVTSVTVAPLPVTIVSTSSVVCAGNTATLVASAAANSYSWFPVSNNSPTLVVSPQVNTTYTVAVSDGTCGGTQTMTIGSNPIPIITTAPSFTTVCSGVPVNISANGALSYTWTTVNQTGAAITVTPMGSTTYFVVGSNSLGCTSSSNVAIATNPSPTLAIVPSANLVCSGDLVNISVTGATTYTWNSGAITSTINVSPLATAVYTVTGTLNSCTSMGTVEVSVFAPTLSISGNTSICVGESATLTASFADTHTWDNGFNSASIIVNPITTTNYSVTALTTSAGISCPSSSSVQVTVKPNPTLTAVPSRSAMCKGESNVITVSGASTYTWDNGSNSPSLTFSSSLVTTLNFSVVGTSSLGCNGSTFVQMKVGSCTGIEAVNLTNKSLLVYPNPSNGNFSIESDRVLKLEVMNELGQVVQKMVLDSENGYKANVTNLPVGIYFIVSNTNGSLVKEKIVITK